MIFCLYIIYILPTTFLRWRCYLSWIRRSMSCRHFLRICTSADSASLVCLRRAWRLVSCISTTTRVTSFATFEIASLRSSVLFSNLKQAWYMAWKHPQKQYLFYYFPQQYATKCRHVCGWAVNTSNSGSGGLGFKPRLSRCFLRQGTLVYSVFLDPGV